MKPNVPSLSDRDMIGRTLLGRYRIVKLLGSGGMGIVYLASAKGAAGFIKPVVVKLILSGLVSDQKFSGMFIREAKILSCLKDPGIIDVIDFAEEDGLYIMVLEYVHGYQLRQWLKYLTSKGRRIPANVCIQIVSAVCDSLHYAHTVKNADGTSLQVIHRDISTPNILLDTDGHVKLVDFGIARISGTTQEYVTQENTFKGKFCYTAPEVFSGAEPSVASDVYACGVVLHEILTGENIFSGKDLAGTFARVMKLAIPSVHGYRDDAPDNIDSVIGKALAKSPADRYQTAQEFAQTLRQSCVSSERETIELLRDLVRADFNEEMAAYLDVDPLQNLERLWRHPSLGQLPVQGNIPPVKIDGRDSDTPVIATEVSVSVDETVGGPEVVIADQETTDPFVSKSRSARGKRLAAGGDRESSKPSAIKVAQRDFKAGISRLISQRLTWVAATAFLVIIAVFVTAKVRKVDKENSQYLLVQSPIETPAAVGTATAPSKQDILDRASSAHTQEEQVGDGKLEPKTIASPKATADRSLKSRHAAEVGSSNLQLVTRAFRKREKDIQICFQRHAAELLGKPQIVVHFQVDPFGRTEHAALTPPTLAETVLGKCLLSVAITTQFPRQEGTISFRIPVTAQRTATNTQK